MKASVRVIMFLTAVLLCAYMWVHYKSQPSEGEILLNNDEISSDHIARSDRTSHVSYELPDSSPYNSFISDYEFPNCQNRTIYNSNAEYSLPDILNFIHKYIPPPADFVGHIKNPCWFANYDKEFSDLHLNVEQRYAHVARKDYSYLLPKTSGTQTLHCLPYMYLLGYPKCGTTSLYEYFKMHPEFATMSSRGFGWIGTGTSGLVDKYPRNAMSVFRFITYFYLASRQVELSSTGHHVNNKIIADFSPANSWRQQGFEQHLGGSMCDPPLLLREMQPDAKFVVLLREPIDRLYSAFWFYAGDEYQKELTPEIFVKDVQTFFLRLKQCDKGQTMLKCLREAEHFEHHFKDLRHSRVNKQLLTGFYYLYLLPWLQVFPRENFLFIRTEDMKKDTGKALQEIFQFLGMSPLENEALDSVAKKTRHNQTALHSSSDLLLSSSTKRQLRAYFRPFNEKLAELLNDDRFLWDDID